MLLVQNFLNNRSLKDLEVEHGVYTSLSKNKRKISLNYDMIETKDDDELSWDCRGLILSKEDFSEFDTLSDDKLNKDVIIGCTSIIAFGLRRFFNFGQGSCATIHWADPKLSVMEKLDGSLIIAYFDKFNNNWCVATRSVPEADLLMDNGLFSFRTLFEKALKDTLRLSFEEFSTYLNKHSTYCFELTTPYNRIVVNYPDNKITLLAVRNLITLQEEDPRQIHILNVLGIPIVHTYTYTSTNELVNWVSSLDPSQHEGVVVRDSNFNRIKIKNAAYVAASKIRDQLASSPKNCLEVILLGKDDDVASFLPEEIRTNLFSIKEKFVIWLKKQEDLVKIITTEASSIATDKKTFALTVQKYNPTLPAMFFNIYDRRANSAKDFIEKNRKDGTWSNSFLDKILSAIYKI